jgi:hypothetical protein
MMARRTLGLSRDGSRAVIAVKDRLFLVETQQRAPTVSVDVGPVSDIAGVGGELWVAAGLPTALHRFAADGVPIGKPVPLWGEGGLLRAVAVGAPGALWTAQPQAMLPADRAPVPILGEPDCVIPVSLNRWVVCRRDRIALADLGAERWSVTVPIAGERVIDGAVLFEGRTVALVVGSRVRGAGHLVVLSLHDGAIHHRIALNGVDLVRFAPARGFVLLRSGPRNLVLFDLRFGRVLKEHAGDREIVDAALDDGGQTFIIRYDESPDDVAVGSVRALLAEPGPAATTVTAAPTAHEPEVIEVMRPSAPAEPAPPAPEFHRGHAPLGAVAALSPRPQMPPLAAAQALALLERYRELVAALVGRAIARAWDDGRLVFPDEGALPFLGEVTGLLGRTAGAAPAETRIAEDQVARATEEAQAAEAQAGPGLSPLTALATEFGLSPLARMLLLVIGGPSLWGELARLYGILGNDDARPLVDELLLVQIFAGQADRHEIARELDRDAPLVRHGLIRCREGRMRPFLALTCEPIVLRLLRAADCWSGLDDLEIVPATRELEELLIPAPTKDAIVRAVAVGPAGPGRVVVRGRSGAGRHTLLATLAKAANRALAVIDATTILRDMQRRPDRLRVALRQAHLLGLLPCVDGLDALPADDRAARDVVAHVLDDHPGPLAVRLPWDGEPILAPGYVQIDLPALSIEQRTACWHHLVAEHALTVREPEELAGRYSVGPGVVARACAQVAAAQDVATTADVAAPLEVAVRQYLESRLKATASRVQRLATWSRVVLPPDIQESVLELIARIKHRRTVYDTWGYDSVLTTSRGVTALFQGGPGTGKTLVASAIANELGMDLYRVDLSRVMSKWIGETEQNLAKLFDAAEDGHAIILFDEADSLFAKRTEVRSSVDRYANLEVNYLLQRFDTFEGIAILTTNFGTSIDSAFKRRLSFRLTFPFPDEEAREALWRSHISPRIPRHGEIDFAELARRYRLSGGYIRNAAVRAAFLAAEEHSSLTQEHLERAVKAEFREIGKLGEGGILE